MINRKLTLQHLARLFIFAWFFIGGIAHFARPALFLQIMPPYIPFHLSAVYISGAFELMGAVALCFKPLRSMAGYGLMLLTLLVTPANVYMLQHAELFTNVPEWALVIRLPFQALLIWLIWWCSRDKMPKQIN